MEHKNKCIYFLPLQNGKGSVFLEYYFNKLQVFCDYSFKLLAEMIHQMDMIEKCYKTEV